MAAGAVEELGQAGAQIVVDGDADAQRKQAIRQGAADKAGAAGNERLTDRRSRYSGQDLFSQAAMLAAIRAYRLRPVNPYQPRCRGRTEAIEAGLESR